MTTPTNDIQGETPGSKLSEIKRGQGDLRPPSESEIRLIEAEAEKQLIEADGLRREYDLRDRWSEIVKKALKGVILFQAVLVSWVGVGWWQFEGNTVFLNTVAAELFIQIVGMGYIIVRCLFPDKSKRTKKQNSN